MRLQKIKAYSKDDREQYKYQITIPKETVETLGWKEGSELKDSVKGKSLVIDFVSPPTPRVQKVTEPKMSYEEFRDKIKNLLQYSDGMTWSEIRSKLDFPQVVPNNKWVRQMEEDVGLLRIKDPRGLIWRLKHV
ncbi:MAG TPA: AbrB/MazE/SpoVT family DNA-binding domain-containing protein [Nitrososphaera sp.]|nr:AbrB/MazE/SpoVT family DNA-binding domain-containing protein [Nitrososphaera sp.]